MIGELTPTEIDQFLHSQNVGRIGCYDKSMVYVVPITYVYDGQYLYGHSREGLKIDMMRKNPKICFEVDEVDSITNWKSVIIQGDFQELIGEMARHAMALLVDKIRNQLSAESDSLMGVSHFHQHEKSAIQSVIFRIEVLEKTGRFEQHT